MAYEHHFWNIKGGLVRHPDGHWSIYISQGVVNLADGCSYNINSQYNEEGIFISSDGNTLYFASQGHNSIGGYDIFKSTLDSNNNWSKPINLGYPINTIWDDLYYFESKDGSKAYFTSDRPGGLGGYDLYEFDK